MPVPMSTNPLAEPLIRIGEKAIARENNAALDAYFSPDFIFHGPGGDLTYPELKAYFASLRAALSGMKVERAAIIAEGNYLAARTVFSGKFDFVFTAAPGGPLKPNGREIRWEVMNHFRFEDNGRLAEEWVQYDVRALNEQFGAPASRMV
ncbi:nuclear transport factor 2 family protein [Devosia sp. 1566]|uniref:ester cyclase n=1 Tax=Devosia sp. 1566 TaxID=2499144 RepID=UPI000FDAB8DB|nr:nuclear transport factor 2 family protein [Devosia sp. 1566]